MTVPVKLRRDVRTRGVSSDLRTTGHRRDTQSYIFTTTTRDANSYESFSYFFFLLTFHRRYHFRITHLLPIPREETESETPVSARGVYS